MRLTLTLTAGLLMTAAPCLADGPTRVPVQGEVPEFLEPRTLIPAKPPWVSKPRDVRSQLIVKFVDHAKARPIGGDVRSLTDMALAPLDEVTDRFDVTFESVFDIPESAVHAVEQRAAIASGRAQPDLMGMMFVRGAEGQLEAVANELNRLDIVEYVTFLPETVNHSPVKMSGPAKAAATAAAFSAGGGGAIPNLHFEQKHKFVFRDLNGNGDIEVFGPDGDQFTLADNEWFGGFNLALAASDAQLLIDDGLTRNWDPNLNGALGDTMKVAVIEDGADIERNNPDGTHLDLRHVTLEPGQSVLPARFVDRSHGSATLGIIAGKDHGLEGPDRFVEGDNAELGIIGMVPRAEPWFFPTASFEQPGGRLISAITSAFTFFDRGDVLSLSIGFGGAGPLITNPAVASVFAVGSDMGILSVMSAGNDCLLLEDDAYPLGDVNTVVVGAGLPVNINVDPALHPGFPHTRLGFSNHHGDVNVAHVSTTVMVQAWGSMVVTAGYGDRFQNPNDPTDRTRFYTATFGGTSSAAPMVAATAVSMQGVAKMFFGIPLTPAQIRGILVGNYSCQDGVCGDEEFISGTLDPPDCIPCMDACLQFDTPEVDIDPQLIGGQPNWGGAASSTTGQLIPALVGSGFFDDSILADALVLRGTRTYGSVVGLKAPEGNPLIVKSRFGEPGRGQAQGPFPAPTYFFGGFMTDIGVTAQVPAPRTITQMAATVRIATSNTAGMIAGFEAFNVDQSRWDFLGVETDLAPAYHDERMLPNPTFTMSGDHVDPASGIAMIRIWVLGMGFGNAEFFTAYDWLDIQTFNGDFGGGAGGL